MNRIEEEDESEEEENEKSGYEEEEKDSANGPFESGQLLGDTKPLRESGQEPVKHIHFLLDVFHLQRCGPNEEIIERCGMQLYLIRDRSTKTLVSFAF